MKIFTTAQIRACEAYTLYTSGINSEELMERAAAKCVAWIKDNLPKDSLFVVLCGTGNNGGDGLAITRLLHQRGYGVKAFLLQFRKQLSPDCRSNLQRLQNLGKDLVSVVATDTFITDLPSHVIVLDAILGIGLNRPLHGWVATFVQNINQLPNRKIAIDIPSGMHADLIPDSDATVMKAHDTLSFQFYKRCYLHPESSEFAGKIHILDIELDHTFIKTTHTQYKTLEVSDVEAIYKPRSVFGHKGTFGHALIAGGSNGKMGAITLSVKAALRSGAGLVTALVPRLGYHIIQTAVPEAMCRTSGEVALERIDDTDNIDGIGIGPGMNTDPKSAQALAAYIDSCKEPILLDADALNIIAKQPELLARLPKGSILTPHLKEFERLFGENTNTMIQTDHARIQAMRYNINIVLKGHHTVVVTTEGECWYNMNGNAGMATGGSGDVLTGLITGFMAQGYSPQEASIFGVYLHGLAGDMAAKELSQEAMIASDIINYFSKAFLSLERRA